MFGRVDPLEITLSRHQLDLLGRLTYEHPYSVTVRNEGREWLELDLEDDEGNVLETRKLPYRSASLVSEN
jgi:hypothetical protein